MEVRRNSSGSREEAEREYVEARTNTITTLKSR